MKPIDARIHRRDRGWTSSQLEVQLCLMPKKDGHDRRFQIIDRRHQITVELKPGQAIDLINALADTLESR